mmetsp:Transcript_60918/g.178082  ORF Transcript_60918/g.178082 Transcript_60918/m.178082 type:complete len:115 (-) Transcript_60918:2120-2464(-)
MTTATMTMIQLIATSAETNKVQAKPPMSLGVGNVGHAVTIKQCICTSLHDGRRHCVVPEGGPLSACSCLAHAGAGDSTAARPQQQRLSRCEHDVVYQKPDNRQVFTDLPVDHRA